MLPAAVWCCGLKWPATGGRVCAGAAAAEGPALALRHLGPVLPPRGALVFSDSGDSSALPTPLLFCPPREGGSDLSPSQGLQLRKPSLFPFWVPSPFVPNATAQSDLVFLWGTLAVSSCLRAAVLLWTVAQVAHRARGCGCQEEEEGPSVPGLHKCALWARSFPGCGEWLLPLPSPVREKKPDMREGRGTPEEQRLAPSALPPSPELGHLRGACPPLPGLSPHSALS